MSDEQRGYPGAPPGWYADPAGGPGQRWWDGYAWSDAVVAPTTPPGPPPPWAAASVRMSSAAASSLVKSELSMAGLARLTLAYPAISSFIVLLFIRVNATQLRSVGHQFRQINLAAQNGQPAPVLHIPTLNSGTSALLSLNWLLALAALVISLVWQHRAASAARAVGLYARHSPAWGVGSWFVPVVSFWIPFQAIADCLRPDDTNRILVSRYWLFTIGAGVCMLAAVIASLFSSPASLVLCIPAALLSLGVLATAPKVVATIGAAHRSLLEQVGQTSSAGV